MTTKRMYFGLAYGSHGCLPDGLVTAYAVTTRREIKEAVEAEAAMLTLPKAVVREIKWKRLWAHAKRYGLSSVSLELSTKSMAGCLMFFGLTEAEYREHNPEGVGEC